jgi:ABC-type molybdate transport system substrate-binding protein
VNCATNKYTVGGTASGLAGTGLVLQNNAGDPLTVNGNGSFAFATPIASGSAYAVTVKTQPTNPSQTCTVTSGSGTVAASNVTSVAVACTTNKYSVGGTVSGATGALVLQDNAGDDLTVNANGAFTFATQLNSGTAYAVTVKAHPPGQGCAVTNGTGTWWHRESASAGSV